jgi:hypothetical protein
MSSKNSHTTLETFRQFGLALFLSLLLIGCGDRISVQTEADKTVSFGKYHTYALDASPSRLGPWGKQALEETLRNSLAERGLKEVPAADADLFVVSTVFTKEKLAALPKGGVTYFVSNYGPYSWSGVGKTSDTNSYVEGTLTVDFVDSHSRTLVFRGIGSGKTGIDEKNAAAIQEAVTRMMAALPAAGRK